MAWGDDNQQGPWGRPTGGSGGGKNPGPQRPPQGPDLEEFIRRSQNKFKQFFPDEGDNGTKGMLLIVIIAMLIWLSSGIYLVKPDEQGVVLRFGEYIRTTSAGLHYHLPYPVERVETPKVTVVNRVEVGYRSGGSRNANADITEESLMLTGDENIVDINFEVQWKIADAAEFLFNVREPEETVKAVAESAMREVIGKSEIADVLTAGREGVAQETRRLIQGTLDEYKVGIEIVSVNLRDVNPPEQARGAFLDVQSARVDLETARNQAEAYRNDIIPRARGQAQQIMLDAEAYKQEVIARAQGEASRFAAVYNEFKVAKDVTKKRMYLETMETILVGMNKIIVDGKGSQGVLPYLPLPEIKAKQPEVTP
jgi:modulator of FtsH protease HflK